MIFFKSSGRNSENSKQTSSLRSPKNRLDLISGSNKPQQGSNSKGEEKLIAEMWQFLIQCKDFETYQKLAKD